MATMWRASRLPYMMSVVGEQWHGVSVYLAAGQLQRSNWLLKARQKILGTVELCRRRRRRRRRRWLRRRGGRVIFLLICIICILLVPRIFITQSLSMKRKSGHTPYTITPKPSTLNPKPCLLEGGRLPCLSEGAPTLSLGWGTPGLNESAVTSI